MTATHSNADAPHWRFVFLKALRNTGNVSAAARTAGKSRALALRICRNLYPAFDGFNSHRQSALLSMAFNLGQPRLAGFRRMRAAINRGNWALAAHEAEHSLWARQTRHRADEIAGLLRGIV